MSKQTTKRLTTLFPLNLSHSMLTDIWKCEMYFFRSHCQKLVGATTNPHLIAGNHFAKACEIVRQEYYNNGKSAAEAIMLGTVHIIQAPDTGDSIKSNERLAMCLQRYFNKYPLDGKSKVAQLQDGSHAVEYCFEFDTGIEHPDLPDRTVHYKGKIDAILETTLRDGSIKRSIIDEKTCSSVYRIKGTKLIDLTMEEQAYRADGQLIGYAWSAKQLGLSIQEALIRRVPILKEYEAPFEITIPISDFMLTKWANTTFSKLAEIVEKYKYYKTNLDSYPQDSFYPVYNTNACHSYNKACQYIEGCLNDYGEDILATTHKQMVRTSDMIASIPLEEYIESLQNPEIEQLEKII